MEDPKIEVPPTQVLEVIEALTPEQKVIAELQQQILALTYIVHQLSQVVAILWKTRDGFEIISSESDSPSKLDN